MKSGPHRAPTMQQTATRTVLENKWIRVGVDTVARADGSVDEFSVVSRSNFVVVICCVGDALVMTEQYRYASRRWSLELPQGSTWPGESLEDAALRELREETGWVGENPAVVGSEVFEAADWATQHFRVVGVDPVNRGRPHLDFEETGLRCVELPKSQLHDSILDGTIFDAATLSALLIDRLSRARARNEEPSIWRF